MTPLSSSSALDLPLILSILRKLWTNFLYSCNFRTIKLTKLFHKFSLLFCPSVEKFLWNDRTKEINFNQKLNVLYEFQSLYIFSFLFVHYYTAFLIYWKCILLFRVRSCRIRQVWMTSKRYPKSRPNSLQERILFPYPLIDIPNHHLAPLWF